MLANSRGVSCSSHRYGPVLDWVFGSKSDVPSAKKVEASQVVHGFMLKDDFAWMKEENSKVSTFISFGGFEHI